MPTFLIATIVFTYVNVIAASVFAITLYYQYNNNIKYKIQPSSDDYKLFNFNIDYLFAYNRAYLNLRIIW